MDRRQGPYQPPPPRPRRPSYEPTFDYGQYMDNDPRLTTAASYEKSSYGAMSLPQQTAFVPAASASATAAPTDGNHPPDSEKGGVGLDQAKPSQHLVVDGVDPHDPNRPKFGLRRRMHHFTWAWFTLVMSTGGISLLLFAQPHQFNGLRQIGLAFYILTVVLFALTIGALVTRFVLYPKDLKNSVTHSREGFFVPTFFLSCATMITSTQRYAIPENDAALIGAIQAAFWGYLTVTLILAVLQYSFVFAGHSFKLHTMMPTWILPIFPIMLSGTIASVIADTQPDIMAVPIIVGGLVCQGLGISVSFMMYAHMVGRLMQAGLPNREHRPGLYMNVGPPSFTALAFIGMANGLPDTFDAGTGMAGILDAAMIRTMAVIGAVFLWGLSAWWFGVATVAVLLSRPKDFHLGWWAMVFPNVGFVLATISLANVFKSEPVLFVCNVMSIGLICIYFFVLFFHIKAVVKQDIMYPGRDEDIDDH